MKKCGDPNSPPFKEGCPEGVVVTIHCSLYIIHYSLFQRIDGFACPGFQKFRDLLLAVSFVLF